jgi:uncharacterized protein
MATRPLLERLSWIAGIAGTLLAFYVWLSALPSRLPSGEKSSVASRSQSQSQANETTESAERALIRSPKLREDRAAPLTPRPTDPSPARVTKERGTELPTSPTSTWAQVEDQAAILSSQDEERLRQLLASYESETTHHIAVLTIRSLGGESIEEFSLRVANAWGLGRRGVDNGILVIIAPSERQVRIEIGRGFEKYISDARAAEIIEEMTPAFREARFSDGLERGLHLLMRDGRAYLPSG